MMAVDERIRGELHRSTSRGFLVLYILLLCDLLYRQFYLRQPVGEYADIAAIWFVGTVVVGVGQAASGVLSEKRQRRILVKGALGLLLINPVMICFSHARQNGSITSVGMELIGGVIGTALGLALLFVTYLWLNRRWAKRSGLDQDVE